MFEEVKKMTFPVGKWEGVTYDSNYEIYRWRVRNVYKPTKYARFERNRVGRYGTM